MSPAPQHHSYELCPTQIYLCTELHEQMWPRPINVLDLWHENKKKQNSD